MTFDGYQQLVVHPHVGQLLISQLTNYPPALARGVAEHHERLDGSGFPHALTREAISPMGRLLAVTEHACAVLRGEAPYLARASVALRVVPGEFDLSWVRRISDAARLNPGLHAQMDAQAVQSRLNYLDTALAAAARSTEELSNQSSHAALKEALVLTQHMLGRLRKGWYASGLWSVEAITEQDAAEVEAVEDELCVRLRGIVRATQLRAGELPPAEAADLARLCDELDIMSR